MNKIIMIFAVTLLSCLFYQCDKYKNDFCECIRNENRKKTTSNEENVFPTGDLIISEGNCFPDVVDKYSYPVQYGSEHWYKLTVIERLDACQLPEDVLKSISNLGLIRSFINVPWSVGEMLYLSSESNYKTRYYKTYQLFNSIQELLTRENAAKSLIVYYAAIKLDCYESIDDDWIDEFYYRLGALEYLFTKEEILAKLSHQDKIEVVKSMLAKYREWEKRNHYHHFVIPALVYIMGDDMLPCFDEITLHEVKLENYSEKNYNDVIAFAECFIQ